MEIYIGSHRYYFLFSYCRQNGDRRFGNEGAVLAGKQVSAEGGIMYCYRCGKNKGVVINPIAHWDLPESLCVQCYEVFESCNAVYDERVRQVIELGHTPDSDKKYTQGELELAAIWYIHAAAKIRFGQHMTTWPPRMPFDVEFLSRVKPESHGDNLIKAAALLCAARDRWLAEQVDQKKGA